MPRFARPSASAASGRILSILLCYVLLASTAPTSGASANRATSPAAGTAARVARRAESRAGQLLVRFREGAPEQARESVARARGAWRRRGLRGGSGVEVLDLAAGQSPEAAAVELGGEPAVEYAEPNYLVRGGQAGPADPYFTEQWALKNTGQRGGAQGSDVGAEAAWQKVTGSRQTVVAVVDSGVDYAHPDLANNAWSNPRESVNGRDDDRNGFVDDTRGWDWVAQGGDIIDANGHGTAVAGIIAAEGDNGVGTAGVMWRASLMSLRVLDSTGTGDTAAAVEAIDYAIAHGASVINISWGTDGESRALRDAILRAGRRGVLVVCSAGNAGRNIDAEPYYPASYQLSNLLTIAASDNADRMAAWSNWGAAGVQLAAPGSDILTTQPGGGYRLVSGTSAAAPVASGVAGLVRALHPTLGAEAVRAAIMSGARRVGGLEGVVAGGGVVSASGALDAAAAGQAGGGNGGGNGNGQGNGQGGGSEQGNGGWHGQSPRPGAPGRGVGGRGPDGDFDAAPAAPSKAAPPNFQNQDEVRRRGQLKHTAPAPISANVTLPDCDDDCGNSYPSGGASSAYPSDPYFATARNELQNETGQPGVDPGSRNFNWGMPLVQLAGRAGLDLSIGLYYNSLVWTKQGSTIQYNADHGFPGPGFRLGFPILQPRHLNASTGLFSYELVTPTGGRVEMRQIGATNTYESADGSFTHLTDNGPGNVVVRTSDGTQLTFVRFASVNEYRCTEIKDRNGNRITINYDQSIPAGTLGRPTSVVDTTGRVITFHYDIQKYLTKITQERTREVPGGIVSETHEWAKFYYNTHTLQPAFTNLTVAATTNQAIPVLERVDVADKSFFVFEYEPGWGMVRRISHYGPDPGSRLISYTSYNLPPRTEAQTDCPRFTQRRDWAMDWNNEQEAVTTLGVAENVTWTMPDNTQRTGTRTTVTSPPFANKDGVLKQVVNRVYAPSPGWDAGLTVLEETYEKDVASGVETRQRQVSFAWAQDVTATANLSIPDHSFENLSVGAGNYIYNPNWGWWSFAGQSGISGNGSGFTSSNPPAPDGGHVAFLQMGSGSVISQSVGTFHRGVPYILSFRAAQRANWNQGGQDFDVYLGDLFLGTFKPTGNTYGSFSIGFTAPPGTHVLKFVGRNSLGGDNTALIDNVRITAFGGAPSNPRLAELNVYDAGNRKRTTFEYGDYNLPTVVKEYAANASDVLRQTNTSYELNGTFLSRRIIGLLGAREVFENGATLVSRVTHTYDSTTMLNAGAVQQHDGTNYGAGFQLGRGNLTEVRRFNVTAPLDQSLSVSSATGYDTAGNVVWEKDASDHTVNIDYADSFSLGGAFPATRAYPTTVTDGDSHAATAKYNYYLGAVSRSVDQKGAASTFTYDFAGRPLRATNEVNGAYTRHEYDPNWGHARAYATVVAGQGEAYTNTIRDGGGRVRLVVVSNPNSTGQYLATWTKYDSMGRPSEQSNPTEIYGNGVPAGDDAAGYQFTKQSYDWKGRPTLTTFPAVAGQAVGNTKELTYEGCGCAGGEAATVRDERGRRRKFYGDALGRLAKVEELNWDTSVYSTTNYAYNARNQITEINQAGQPRTFVYDGHGRLWKRTTPEQGLTEYSYYKDDTVEWTKDARGAKTVFIYNGRHLPESISYDLSGVLLGQNVAPTANVEMDYDAAGNRTLLDDGPGKVTYVYNTLSQLQSETRTFDGLVNSAGMPTGAATLNYQYNLAGQLTSMYNSWTGVTVGYEHDANGRLDKVTGAGYGGVSTYASNMRYRAFGGLKSMSYNNNRALTAQYDSRQRLTRWEVGGVNGYQYFYDNAANPSWALSDKANRVTFAGNLYDNSLDRSFDYDHVGRLQYSHSGVEARMHVTGQANDGGAYGPYAQHYGYDVWGNLTYRAGWGGANPSYNAGYSNNRRAGLTYDNSGNVTHDGGQAFAYDATGQQTAATYAGLEQSYDGDGLRARKTENGNYTYYLRSSALGGKVVCEINQWGWWARGYVYAGSQLLAVQYASSVHFVHQDPVVKSQRLTDGTGNAHTAVELDPWGGETSRSSNSAFQPQRFTSYLRDGNESDEAMFRRYNRWWSRFDQPDPYDGSYDLADPQSLNRYSYTQNDPVNFVDPMGLMTCFQATWGIEWSQGGTVVRREVHGRATICIGGGGGMGGFVRGIPGGRDIGGGGQGGGLGGAFGAAVAKPAEVTDCDILTTVVSALAADSSTDASFVAKLYGMLRHDREGNHVRSSGFKADFRDETGPGNSPNQVRHTGGAIAWGYAGGSGNLVGITTLNQTLESFNSRERTTSTHLDWSAHQKFPRSRTVVEPTTPSQAADMRLNSVAVPIGFALGRMQISRHNVADLIRKLICE